MILWRKISIESLFTVNENAVTIMNEHKWSTSITSDLNPVILSLNSVVTVYIGIRQRVAAHPKE